ncbi:hypothetical protein DXG03_007842 [Asterophora parasitica]|uniref:Uncharacterized protein n=1 Tax=Asterophora parasitica TaxID=117018 RepID=A0A9P7GDA3_9AGAR|nr:hypothetical protein DXG03_007842 [Asterophora parasitica]
MHPSICPLCRKAFLPNRSKKLITGELETEDAEKKALDLLQKLVVSWDRNTTEDERISLATDVDLWLGAGNEHQPLAKAHEVIRAYHSLKAERHDNHRSIIRLQQKIERRELAQLAEKDQMEAVQESLLSQIQELESYILRHEGEREAYRRGASTSALRNNPLPMPPQPAKYDISTSHTNGSLFNGSSYTLALYEDAPASQTSSFSSDRNGKSTATPTIPSASSSSRTRGRNNESGGPTHTIIPGASPNQRFVPRSVLDDPPPWISDSNGDGLDASATVNPYAMVGDYMNEFVEGYVEGYQLGTGLQPSATTPAFSSRRSRASRSSTGPSPAPLHSPILDTPTRPRGSSRPSGSRTLTLGDFMRPAQAGHDATSGSRHGPSGRRRPSQLEELLSDDISFTVPSPSAAVQAGLSSSSSAPVSASSSSTPVSAPPQPSSFNTRAPQAPRPSNDRASNSRSRPQRRLSDMTNIATTWQPPLEGQPQATSPSVSSLRRRSAFTATMPQTVFIDHSTPTSIASEIDSLAEVVMPASVPQTPTGSISSWGTVNTANPAPPETQPMRDSAHFIPTSNIISVRDLRLRSFEDVYEGDNESILSDFTLDDGHDDEVVHVHPHDGAFTETPRSVMRTVPSSEPVAPARPPSQTFALEHVDAHQEPAPPPGAPETFYRPELVSTPAASVSSRHSHASSTYFFLRYRASRPRQLESTSTALSPSTPSSITNRLTGGWPTEESPSAMPPNALGLLERSYLLPEEPEISAPRPTPTMATRRFLATFNETSPDSP